MARTDEEIDELYEGVEHDPDVCGLTDPEKGGNKPHCPACVPIWLKAVLRKVAAQEKAERVKEFKEAMRRREHRRA